jgi:hypothetical protein
MEIVVIVALAGVGAFLFWKLVLDKDEKPVVKPPAYPIPPVEPEPPVEPTPPVEEPPAEEPKEKPEEPIIQ